MILKKIIFAVLVLLTIKSFSYGQVTRVSCDFVVEIGWTGYVGVYKSYSGRYYEMRFNNYCPFFVNL